MRKKSIEVLDRIRDFFVGSFNFLLGFLILIGNFFRRFFLMLWRCVQDFFKGFFNWVHDDIAPFLKWFFSGIWGGFLFLFKHVSRFFIFVFSPVKRLFIFLKPYFLMVFGPVGRLFAKVFKPVFVFFNVYWLRFKIKMGWAGKQPIEMALDDLNRELVFLDVFNIVLNSLIGFLAGVGTAIVFNFGWEFALIPAVVVLIYYFIVYFNRRRLLLVEEKVPKLHERLRTAADNINRKDEITNDLKQEVVHDMKNVETTLFIDLEGVSVRLFSIAIIAFVVVILSFLDLTFDFQFAPVIHEPVRYIRERVFTQEISQNASIPFTAGNLSDIYGNKTALIMLGDERIELQLNPLQSELNFDEISEAEQRNFNPPVYPKEIYTSYDASYTEKIAKKNQAVVKSYFEQISR